MNIREVKPKLPIIIFRIIFSNIDTLMQIFVFSEILKLQYTEEKVLLGNCTRYQEN